MKFTHEQINPTPELPRNEVSEVPKGSPESEDTRIEDLKKELIELEKFGFLTEEEIDHLIVVIHNKANNEQANNEISNSVDNVLNKAFAEIDYVDYINDIAGFLENQDNLQLVGKPSLKVNEILQDVPDNKWAAHYFPFKKKIEVSIDNSNIGGLTTNPLGRLYNLAKTGNDLVSRILQHETIHHHQRVRAKSKFHLMVKMFNLSDNVHWKIIHEIHARLHDRMLISPEGSDKEIIEVLLDNYHLNTEDADKAMNALVCIKKLYALDVSNRRIARLVRDITSFDKIHILENEVASAMTKESVSSSTLEKLIEIDNIQRDVVKLRTMKYAQEEVVRIADVI